MNTMPRNEKVTFRQEVLRDLYDFLHDNLYSRTPYIGYRVEFNYPWKSVEILGPFTKNQGFIIDIQSRDIHFRITNLQWHWIADIPLADPNYKQTLIKLVEGIIK